VLAGVAMVGGAVAVGGAADALATDEYDVLHGRWADVATGGAIDPTDPAYAIALARLNSGGSTNPITRRYPTMWLDHGISPTAATYAYTLSPASVPRPPRNTGILAERPFASISPPVLLTHVIAAS
jgi:hypothetical protein